MRFRMVSAVVGLAVTALLACGPSKSTQALLQARKQIRVAIAMDAEKKKPYELQLAREYYVKAKEEAGYSKFELAEQLAKQSISYGKIAAGESTATPTPALESEESQ